MSQLFVSAILSQLFCLGYIVSAILSQLFVSAILSRLFCLDYFVWAILSRLSYPVKSQAAAMLVKRLNHYFVLEMDQHHIGILPEPDAVLPHTTISIFGILANHAFQEEDCHFCLEKITKRQLFVIKLPCCGHHAHTDCFRTWALSSLNTTNIRSAYCRAVFDYDNRCFLRLDKPEDQDVKCNSCCHSKVHEICAKELKDLFTLIMFEHIIECGQLNQCHCLWVHV